MAIGHHWQPMIESKIIPFWPIIKILIQVANTSKVTNGVCKHTKGYQNYMKANITTCESVYYGVGVSFGHFVGTKEGGGDMARHVDGMCVPVPVLSAFTSGKDIHTQNMADRRYRRGGVGVGGERRQFSCTICPLQLMALALLQSTV